MISSQAPYFITRAKMPFSKSGHIHRIQGLGQGHIFGGSYSTHFSANMILVLLSYCFFEFSCLFFALSPREREGVGETRRPSMHPLLPLPPAKAQQPLLSNQLT